MGLNVINYALMRSKITSVVTGVSSIVFDSNGDLVVTCTDGSTISRSFIDIKKIEFVEQEDGKHLVVEYSNGISTDLGVYDPKFDINDLITVGTSADEATATTPLFINIDSNSGGGSGSGSGEISDDDVASDDDLDDLWNS